MKGATAMRYAFEFISNYDGVTDYRLYINGKPDTRFCVSLARECFYSDGSAALASEVAAFNADRRENHAQAVEKYGVESVGPFVPYRPLGMGVAA